LMKTGGWLTASEAKEWGFVDDITDYEEDIKPHMTEELATALATASIPIPAIPYADPASQRTTEPLLSRLISALTALFHPVMKADEGVVKTPEASAQSQENIQTQTTNTTITPMKQMPKLEAALKTEGFTANAEGGVTLTEAQLQCLEDHLTAQETKITAQEGQLTERNTRITQLEAEVTALKGTPAATSPAVVNAQKEGTQQPTKAEEYLAHVNSAKELYDLVGG